MGFVGVIFYYCCLYQHKQILSFPTISITFSLELTYLFTHWTNLREKFLVPWVEPIPSAANCKNRYRFYSFWLRIASSHDFFKIFLIFFKSSNQIIFFIIQHALNKKWSFPLKIFSVNVTKSAGNCGFVHIYWRNRNGKLFYLFYALHAPKPSPHYWKFF